MCHKNAVLAPLGVGMSASDEARKACTDLKEQGSAKLKAGELEAAAELYRQSLAAGASLPPEELAPIFSNLSMANLKRGAKLEALDAANECVEAKPEWQKAHYRKGEALFELARFEEARMAYSRAQELAAEDRDISAALALTDEAIKGGVWFRQLRPGREFALAASTPLEELIFGAARQMQNHIYLVGCASTRECYVVDPCWDTTGIAAYARRCKMRLVGALGTHYHFDHCGVRCMAGTPDERRRRLPAPAAHVLAPCLAAPRARCPSRWRRWSRDRLAGNLCTSPRPLRPLGPPRAAADSLPRVPSQTLPGLREMAREHGAKAHIHAREVARIAQQCDLDPAEIVPLEQGATLPLGDAGALEVRHAPGVPMDPL